MKKLLLISLILGLIAGCSGFGKKSGSSSHSSNAESADLNLDVKKYTLPNGLRLLVYENPRLPIFSYYTFYNVGGRHEDKGTTGATHFLEHMMFKGAKKYGPGMFDQLIEGNGGNNNAYTTFDGTVYYENMPSEQLDTVVDLESDRMENLLLLPPSFESERKVVMEERRMRYENSPRGQVYLAMMQAVFEKTPYGGSVIGDVADLKSIDRNQVHNFFKKFYTPDNAIIIVAGDVNASDVYAKVLKKFGHLKPSTKEVLEFRKTADDPKRFEHRGRYGREIKLNGATPKPMFMLAYKGEPLGTQRGFVMDILSSVLGDGESSYFTQKYVKGRRPILAGISAANYTLKNNGVFYISGELLKNTSLKKFKRTLLKDTSRMCDKAITDRAVQKTKNQYMVQFYHEIQTNNGVAHFLGLRESFFGDYEYYKKEIGIYNNVTTQEVKDACYSVFNDKKYIFLSVWNKHPKSKKGKR